MAELYRKNAGIALVKNGQVLLFERSDVPGAWQLPQGGVDEGEAPEAAAYRELLEETGIPGDSVKLIGEYPEWLSYDLPAAFHNGNYKGQTQRWFVFEFEDESVINLAYDDHQEFTNYTWIPIDELESIAVDFRKPTYKKLAQFIASLAN